MNLRQKLSLGARTSRGPRRGVRFASLLLLFEPELTYRGRSWAGAATQGFWPALARWAAAEDMAHRAFSLGVAPCVMGGAILQDEIAAVNGFSGVGFGAAWRRAGAPAGVRWGRNRRLMIGLVAHCAGQGNRFFVLLGGPYNRGFFAELLALRPFIVGIPDSEEVAAHFDFIVPSFWKNYEVSLLFLRLLLRAKRAAAAAVRRNGVLAWLSYLGRERFL